MNSEDDFVEMWEKLTLEDQAEFSDTILEVWGYDQERIYSTHVLDPLTEEQKVERRRVFNEEHGRRLEAMILRDAETRAYMASLTPEIKKAMYDRWIKSIHRLSHRNISWYLNNNMSLGQKIKGIFKLLISPLKSYTRWPEKKANFKKWKRTSRIWLYIQFINPKIYRHLYRMIKYRHEMYMAMREIRKMEKTKTLFSNPWLSLKDTNGYIFSHEQRSGGKAVAILVVDSNKPDRVLLRYETVPCHFDSENGPTIVSITGGRDGNDRPIDTCLKELEEEAGYKATEDEVQLLGVVRPSKSADTIIHLFVYDAAGKTQGEALGDGSDGEKDAYTKWGSIEDAINCKDPLMSTMIARYMLKKSPDKFKEI